MNRQDLPKTKSGDHTLAENLDELRIIQREKGLGTNYGAYTCHVYQVFCDNTFKKEIKELKRNFEELYYPDVSLSTNIRDKHLLLEDKEKIKRIADKYRITLEDFGFFADGYFECGYLGFGEPEAEKGGLHIGEEEHSDYPMCYIIGPKTTLNDIKKNWNYIRDLRKNLFYENKSKTGTTRNKSPEHPQLIYAIFKARSYNKTFRTIYSEYEDNKLTGYSGNTNLFSDEESLERYYRKYAPNTQPNFVISQH